MLLYTFVAALRYPHQARAWTINEYMQFGREINTHSLVIFFVIGGTMTNNYNFIVNIQANGPNVNICQGTDGINLIIIVISGNGSG